MKVLLLSSLSFSLINFRGELLRELAAAGHEVIAGAPDGDEAVLARLKELGVGFRHTPMARAGTNPFRDALTLLAYLTLFVRERPDVVIAYSQKPIIYGGLAARLVGGLRFYVLMSGLGYVYSSEARHRRLLRGVVSKLYRVAVARAEEIFVFNGDDRRVLMHEGIIDPSRQVVQVPGSGVDCDHFQAQPLPAGPPTFLMMARLMRDKGVGEFIAAAALVRRQVPRARFQLLGRPETENPTGYSAEAIAAYCKSGLIEHLPHASDVRPYLADAHALVLPSYYREGLPRSLLEALASGRPIITTDMPGCREPVRPDENGFLVQPRDAEALADAMLRLIADPLRLTHMSRRAREVALDTYDVKKVNRLLLRTMRLDAHPQEAFSASRRAASSMSLARP